MDFRIRGHLGVSNEGQPVRLAGSKQRALLAMLLLHANEPVSVDTLAEELWTDDPHESAAKNIQVQISRLRRARDGHQRPNGSSGAASTIVTRPHSYLIRVEPEQLDVDRFQRLVAEGTEALSGDAPLGAEAIFFFKQKTAYEITR